VTILFFVSYAIDIAPWPSTEAKYMLAAEQNLCTVKIYIFCQTFLYQAVIVLQQLILPFQLQYQYMCLLTGKAAMQQ
jgi:hypothetical protein